MAHLNDKGEVCHCGFGKHQPQLDWHVGSVQIQEVPANTYLKEPGRPFAYDENSQTIYLGPPGSTHWGLSESLPNLEDLVQGRIQGKRLEWFGTPLEGTDEVEKALGVKSHEEDWDFTEPMATEPSPEESHHDVQISNDEPGVPTIGA